MTKHALILGVLVLVATPMAAPAPADAAAIVCKKGKKLLLREDTCKGKEQQVTLSGAGIDVSTLPAVPLATEAAKAIEAETATEADTADTAESATSAETCDVAEEATNADTLDGLDSTEFAGPLRWVNVASGCTTIVTQSGGISIVALDPPVPGICVLDFGSDLRGHGVSATVRGGLTNKGWAQTAICGGPDAGLETSNCNVTGAANAPNELAIATLNETGTATDRAFYAVVTP